MNIGYGGVMIDNNAIDLLKGVIPFNSLGEEGLCEIAATMEWTNLPRDTLIIPQGSRGLHFYLIKSGLVKVYLLDETGKETTIGFLGEADCFGEISLLTDGPTTTNVRTIEHTVCLVQHRDDFLRMTQKYPMFHKFFNQLLSQRMRTVYKELLTERPGVSEVEPFLYRKQVKDILPATLPLCGEGETLKEAARNIIEKGVGSLVVVGARGEPQGVLRMRAVMKAVVLDGKDSGTLVQEVMEKDFRSIPLDSYFFDALQEMTKHKVSEVVVLDEGRTVGMLTGHDLLRFRGREVLSLVRNIDDAPDFSQLNAMRGEVEKVLRALMQDGALASQACRIVSELNDRVVRRVITLVEEERGAPPVPFAWLGMGSEGRKEQTLFTDQDNALVFTSDPPASTREYFKAFAEGVVAGLAQCGIPLCKGGIMATSPKYFGDVADWKERVSAWLLKPELGEKELMDTYVFLDFRSIYGERELETSIRSLLAELVGKHPAFLKNLAGPIVSVPMPIGFFKNFIVEKGGKHKDELNLKLYGLVPLVTCAKILALHTTIAETGTLGRLAALRQRGVIPGDLADILEQAFETFLGFKIKGNLADIEKGRELSNHVNPAQLSTRQKQFLKEAFWAVSELQKITKDLLGAGEGEFGLLR
jgi:CBS domain-containing protein